MWTDLSMKDKSDLMSLFLKQGISSLSDMKRIYDGTQDIEEEEYSGGNINASKVSTTLSRNQWNNLYRQGKVSFNEIPRKYQSWIEGENSYLKQSVTNTINNAGNKIMPVVLGTATGGVGGAVAGLANTAFDMGVNAVTKGKSNSWGEALVDFATKGNAEEHPYWTMAAELTNPMNFLDIDEGIYKLGLLNRNKLKVKDSLLSNYNNVNNSNHNIILDSYPTFNNSLNDKNTIDLLNYDNIISIVDKNGNINTKNLVDAYKEFLKQNRHNIKYGLNTKYLSTNGTTTLKKHLSDVVKSAQEIPLPIGVTRQDLVRSALVHDLGKLEEFTDVEHGITSSILLSRVPNYGWEFSSPNIKEAIESHMMLPYNDIKSSFIDSSNLTKALQVADVSRGTPYEQMAIKYPYLFRYNKEGINPTFYNGTEEEVLNNIVRPWAKRYGYAPIKKGEDLYDYLNKTMERHRSFFRGARDPYKISDNGEITAEDARNYRNASFLAKEYLKEDTPINRTLVSLTNVPLDPTGSGRLNLFSVTGSELPEHKLIQNSNYLKINPSTEDGLYVSLSPDIMKNYRKTSDERLGMGAVVTLPFNKIKRGDNVAEFLSKNEIALFDASDMWKSMSDFQMFELPYRLQTGRSLSQDLKPKLQFSNNKFADLNFEYNQKTFNRINNILKKYNKSLYKTKDNKAFGYNDSSLRRLNTELDVFNNYTTIGIRGLKSYLSDSNYKKYMSILNSGKREKAKEYAEKYILTQNTLNKILNKFKPRKYNIEVNKVSSKDKLDFLRQNNVIPLFEIPDFWNTQMFISNGTWGDKPISRFTDSKKSGSKHPQAYIIGKKGQKLLEVKDIISDDNIQKMLSDNKYTGRDQGTRWLSETLYPVSRKVKSFGGNLK